MFPTPTNWRGAFAYDFVKALEKDGRYRVVVFKGGTDYEIDGVQVHGYKSYGLPSGIPCPICWKLNQWLFARALNKAGIDPKDVAVVDGFTNDLVNVAQVVKRANPRAKMLTHHHDLASFGVSSGRFRHFYPFKLIKFFRMRKLQEMVDLHVFISEQSRRSFLSFPDTRWTVYDDYRRISRGLRHFRSARIKDFYILHNGVDTKTFRRLDVQPFRRDEGKFVIGCVANFVALKDQETLIRAVARINELEKRVGVGDGVGDRKIKVLFVGSGETLERCRQVAVELGVDAEFRTEVRHEQLAAFYQGIDLFVLPSYFEGFGCVYLEASACGVPFIGCEGQGIEDMIHPEDRKLWLARPRDADDLAEKIRHYITCRPEQRLTGEIEINRLVAGFLDYLESK